MIMISIYIIIAAWSAWCVLSHQVRDGIFGKALYSASSITAFVAVMNQNIPDRIIEQTLLICFAGIGIRHFIIVKLKERRGKHGKHKPA